MSHTLLEPLIGTLKPLNTTSSRASFLSLPHRLDASDPATGAARPVLVMADSSGAAEDIFNYCNQVQ